MTEPSPLGLFALSTELRLEVYRHLVDDCLTTGCPQGLSGVLFSCSEVYHELVNEFVGVPRITALLIAQAEWNKVGFEDTCVRGIPLGMRLSNMFSKSLVSQFAPAELTIVLPTPHSWVLTTERPAIISSFRRLVTSLRPTFCLRWSSITIDFIFSKYGASTALEFATRLCFGIFQTLDSQDNEEWEFKKTDRLVLNYVDTDHLIIGKTFFLDHFLEIWSCHLWNNVNYRATVPRFADMFKSAWIVRDRGGAIGAQHSKTGICKDRIKTEPGWKLVIDLRPDMAPAEGALWKFEFYGDDDDDEADWRVKDIDGIDWDEQGIKGEKESESESEGEEGG